MSNAARKRATYEDLLDTPRHLVAELIDGVLHAHPRPASRHAFAASLLGGELVPAFWRGRGGPGGWWILDEPECHLCEDVLVPDLAGWRRERLPAFPDVPYFTVAPDWVCEVLSPATIRLDRARKLPIYARERVSHVWLIDPTPRTLDVLELDGATYRLLATYAAEDVVRAPPFDALELALGLLWPDAES